MVIYYIILLSNIYYFNELYGKIETGIMLYCKII